MPTWYSGGLGFKSWSGDWMWLFMVFLSPYRKISGYYFKLAHNCFLPNPFQFIIHWPFCRLTLCSLSYWWLSLTCSSYWTSWRRSLKTCYWTSCCMCTCSGRESLHEHALFRLLNHCLIHWGCTAIWQGSFIIWCFCFRMQECNS
jgi:hypothetical protein